MPLQSTGYLILPGTAYGLILADVPVILLTVRGQDDAWHWETSYPSVIYKCQMLWFEREINGTLISTDLVSL